MRPFHLTLILCTQFAQQNPVIPPNTALALVDNITGNNDQLVLIDPVTNAKTVHTLPFSKTSAVGTLANGELLIADDVGAGSNIYSMPDPTGTPVLRVWTGQRIKRICRLEPDLQLLLADGQIYEFTPSANSLATLVIGGSGEVFVDVVKTDAGFWTLGKLAGETRIAWYDTDGQLQEAHTLTAVNSPLCLLQIDVDHLQIGTADANGTLYGVTLDSGGGGSPTVSPINTDGAPIIRLGRNDWDTHRGRYDSVVVVPPAPTSSMIVIALDGPLLDLTIQ